MPRSVPDVPGDVVEPAYGSRSLADVVPAVAAALGHPLDGHDSDSATPPAPAGLVLPPASAYVVFLVDGLGERLLRRHAADAPYLAGLLDAPGALTGTAGVPSTTATSLTSLGTALPPGAHGLVGYTSRVPGTDRLLNHLEWSKDVDPLQWQPRPTAFARLQAAGVTTSMVSRRAFERSGLTLAGLRGAEYVGADKTGERIAGVVAASAARPSLTYVYDSDLDWTGHRYGVDSYQWLSQLSSIDDQAEQLRAALPADRRLLVVADHGMVDCAPGDRIDVDAHPELTGGLALFGGEARFRHLYCRPGAVDDVLAAWREQLGERALVLTRQEAVERGWFGPVGLVGPAVLPRLGDVVVAALGGLGVFSSQRFARETRLVGLHGSITADEMLIPLLLD